jgi:hypothetical protein
MLSTFELDRAALLRADWTASYAKQSPQALNVV